MTERQSEASRRPQPGLAGSRCARRPADPAPQKGLRCSLVLGLDPRKVRVERDDQHRVRYVVAPTGERSEVTFDARIELHIHGLSFDGLTGYSVAHLARESSGAALAAEKSGASLFGNGSRPAGVLRCDNRLQPEAIKNLIDATYSNIESQSREYVVDALQRRLVRWEQEIARKLISARSQLFAEHWVDGLLRGDTEA